MSSNWDKGLAASLAGAAGVFIGVGIVAGDPLYLTVILVLGGLAGIGYGIKFFIEHAWDIRKAKNPPIFDLPPAEEIYSIIEQANAGNTEAQFTLGCIFGIGYGTIIRDDAKANEWTYAAAKAGHKNAQYQMGINCLIWTPPNLDFAIEWFQMAANQDVAFACLALGDMYENVCLPKDPEKAKQWHTRGAEILRTRAMAGDKEAQNNYGVLYSSGVHNHPKDYAQAMIWFEKAAAQGDVVALANIGDMYQRGEGVPKDEAQAIHWYSKAVKAGGERVYHQFDYWMHRKVRQAVTHTSE